MIAGLSSFCTETAGLIQFIGYILLVLKVAIPIVIIILGAMDFGKAVVAEKDDEIKAKAKRLLFRAIAGICIFFIPNFVLWIFGLVSEMSSDQDAVGFSNCKTCLLYPTSADCTKIAK